MKHLFKLSLFKWIAAAAIGLVTPMAGASDVNWSVSVGSPYPAPQVYVPPSAVVYVQPQPVYVRPRPVYVQPAAVVQYGPTYYVEEGRRRKHKHHHWKHHHEDRYDY